MRPKRVRTLFVSDVHLGFRHSHPQAFLDSVQKFDPEWLVIVGDFIDGRRLRQRWTWTKEFDLIFQHLKFLARHGCQIVYVPGNHDEFLRRPENQFFDFLEVENEFVFQLQSGPPVTVLHGDIYDRTETEKTMGSRFGCRSYDLIVRVHSWTNHLAKRFGLKRLDICSLVKAWIWQANRHIHSFRQKLCRHAQFKRVSGVTCGHIHYPELKIIDGILYMNTGDWVENASVIVESTDGDIELINHGNSAGFISRQELVDRTQHGPSKQLDQVDSRQLIEQTARSFDLAREFQSLICNSN